MNVRLRLAVAVAVLPLPGCAPTFYINLALKDYQGQVLAFKNNGPGKRVLEVDSDRTKKTYIASHGEPDYIYIESGDAIRFFYIDKDGVVLFRRHSPQYVPDSLAEELIGIPNEIARQFYPEDQERLVSRFPTRHSRLRAEVSRQPETAPETVPESPRWNR